MKLRWLRLSRVLFGIAAVALSLLSSCAAESDAPEVKYLVGVSQANLTEPWRVSMTNEIKDEAQKHQGMKVILTDAADSVNKQISDVRQLLGYGIDILIISPLEANALTPIVDEVYSRIPVIVLDRSVTGYNYTLYIGPDNQQIGSRAGKYVAELLGAQGGRVVEIQGRSESPPTLDRSQGFRQVVAKNNRIQIEASMTADWLTDKAEDSFGAFLKTKPKVQVVFAHNDAMALGAYRAAQKAGYSNIKFIGVDGLSGPEDGIELVRKGIFSATFVCPTGGRESILYAVDILNHVEGIPKKIFLHSQKETFETLQTEGDQDLNQVKAPKNRNGRKIVLGFAQLGHESSWRIANTESIKDSAKKAGIELLFVDADQDQKKQIEAIREFIRRKVNVISFSPKVETGWEEVLGEAKRAGIPVILSDRTVDRTVDLKDESLFVTFMGSDFVEEGKRAARWLLKTVKDTTPVRIFELQGTEGSAPAIDRKVGFQEVIQSRPNFQIIDSVVANFTLEEGYSAMKNFLKVHGRNFEVLYAHNDDMALGAIKAMKEEGIRPGKDVIVVSIDAVKGAFQAMIDGELNCTVECSPLLGPQLMKLVQDYEAGKEMPTRIVTAEEVFPAETARENIGKRNY